MSYGFVNSVATQGSGTLDVTTPPIDMRNASLLVAVACTFGNPFTFADSGVHDWALLPQYGSPNSTGCLRFLYAENAHGSNAQTFNLTTPPGNPNYPSIAVVGFSGALASGSFDKQNGSSGAGIDAFPGAVSPDTDGEVLVWGMGWDFHAPQTLSDGFIKLHEFIVVGGVAWSIALAYKIQAVKGIVNPVATNADPTATGRTSALATFRPAVATTAIKSFGTVPDADVKAWGAVPRENVGAWRTIQ